MTKLNRQDQKQQKTTTIIEAEGRLIRLEVDPEAHGDSAVATLSVFAEESRMNLLAGDVARVRRALRTNSPTKGRA